MCICSRLIYKLHTATLQCTRRPRPHHRPQVESTKSPTKSPLRPKAGLLQLNSFFTKISLTFPLILLSVSLLCLCPPNCKLYHTHKSFTHLQSHASVSVPFQYPIRHRRSAIYYYLYAHEDITVNPYDASFFFFTAGGHKVPLPPLFTRFPSGCASSRIDPSNNRYHYYNHSPLHWKIPSVSSSWSPPSIPSSSSSAASSVTPERPFPWGPASV